MRVWLLTSELAGEVAGGIATYVDTFARLAGAQGHDVTVIAPGTTERDERVVPGVRLRVFRSRVTLVASGDAADRTERHPAYPYNVLPPEAALSYEMAEHVLTLAAQGGGPDVVESQEFRALPYFLLQRRLTERTPLDRVPVVVHLHSPDFEIARVNLEPRYRLPRYWIGQMEKFCIVAADRLLAPSRFLAHRVEDVIGRPLDVAVVPYPVAPPLHDTDHTPERGRLLYVGRLEVRKGVLPLVETCSRLWSGGEDFRLTLVGGDDALRPRGTTVGAHLRDRHRQWIDAGRLLLRGQVERASVLDEMRRAWAVVVPSIWENFPNVCLEAMGAGQLVVASTSGGQAELIGTAAGMLFDWSEPGGLERCLRETLALADDERTRIAATARRRVMEVCDPERVLAARFRHFEQAVAAWTGTRRFPSLAATESFAPAGPDGEADLLSAVVTLGDGGESELRVTLESLRRMSHRSHEVVTIDGRRDRATPLPDDVRVVSPEPGARTPGAAEVARGEFLLCVRPGTWITPDLVTRAIEVLRRFDDVAFVYPWVRAEGEREAVWATWNAELPYLLGRNMVPPVVVIRRSAYPGPAHDDATTACRAAEWERWLALVRGGSLGVSLPHVLAGGRGCGAELGRRVPGDGSVVECQLVADRHGAAFREWGVDLAGLLDANGPACTWDLSSGSAVEAAARYDEELGGRLVRRLRASCAGAWVLRRPRLRQAVRRVLGL